MKNLEFDAPISDVIKWVAEYLEDQINSLYIELDCLDTRISKLEEVEGVEDLDPAELALEEIGYEGFAADAFVEGYKRAEEDMQAEE